MRITLKTNIKEYQRGLSDLQKKELPFAYRIALNDTAKHAWRSVKGELNNAFEQPIAPWLKQGFEYVRVAKGERYIDQMKSQVLMQDQPQKNRPQKKILEPHIIGGSRAQKAAELTILGSNRFFYPGKFADRDRYGNLKPSQIGKAISDIGVSRVSDTNTKKAKKKYFLINKKNQRAIVMHRKSKKDRPLPFLVEGRPPTYRPRFDFYGVIKKVIDRNFIKNMEKGMQIAMNKPRNR